jgi:GTP-binding protein
VPDAHLGKGLGHQFLKHIERTRLLVHLLDLAPGEDSRTPWTDFLAINHELACFNPKLSRVPQIVVATKMDVPEVAQRFPDIHQEFAMRGHDVLPISAVTGMGLDTLRNRLSTSLQALAAAC